MPNYNSNYLKRAIKSVINQTHKNWELIIIDNYSTNFPEKIINEFKDYEISFFKFRNNNNIGKSRNFGINKSKFDWIAFLDADDVWENEKLSRVNEIINTTNSDMIYHGMYYLPKKFGLIKKIIKDKSYKIKEPIYENLLKNGNPIANSSVVVRKDKLIEIGMISELDNKFSWEDYECWIRLSSKKYKFYFINEILGYCWIGKGRVSNSYQSYKNCKNFMKSYRKELVKVFKFKKRPDWICRTYFNFFYENKNYLRAYNFIKENKEFKITTFLKTLFLIFNIWFLRTIKKNLYLTFNYFKKLFNKVIICELVNDKVRKIENFGNLGNFQFQIFGEYKKFRNCNNFFYSFNNKIFFERFRKRHELLTLVDINSKKVVCYGWCSNDAVHTIDEVNKKIHLKKGNVLYDFFTLDEYRNKKLYKLLLYQISLNLEKPLYIYSLSKNKKSLKAITKTGFLPIRNLNIFSNDFLQKLH